MGWIATCQNAECPEKGIAKRSLGVVDVVPDDEVPCGACLEACTVTADNDPAGWAPAE